MNLTQTKLITMPGMGVYTVHTAKEYREKLFEILYQSNNLAQIQQQWENSLSSIHLKKVQVLGVASDCGGGIQRGANWGPLFLREQLYQNAEVFNKVQDLGDIKVIPHLLHDKYLNEETIKECRLALYNEANNLPVSPLSITQEFLNQLYGEYPQSKVLSLGGDHSVSYPLVMAWAQNEKNKGKKYALIHFDAHTDLMDKRLGIDLCFGSWTYHVIDQFADPAHIHQIGLRSSGKDRDHWEKMTGVKQYWASEVNEQGAIQIAKNITQQLKDKDVENIYISFDIDALDSSIVSATGTPEANGLQLHQVIQQIKYFGDNFNITGADLVEVAPMVRSVAKTARFEPQNTLSAATSILEILISKMENSASS